MAPAQAIYLQTYAQFIYTLLLQAANTSKDEVFLEKAKSINCLFISSTCLKNKIQNLIRNTVFLANQTRH